MADDKLYLPEEVQELRDSVSKLQNELESERSKHQDSLHVLEDRIESLQRQLTDDRRSWTEKELEYERQRGELVSELSQARSESQNRQSTLSDIGNERQLLNQEKTALMSINQRQQQEISSLQTEVSLLNERIKQMQLQITSLTTSANDSESKRITFEMLSVRCVS